MRFLILALGLVFSLSVHAAKPSPAFEVDKKAGPAFAKKIAGASSWEELFDQMKDSLPTPVMKEFEKLSKEVPFPDMRAEKSTLILIDSSGKRLYISFGKEGSAIFNGKEWKLRPLAPLAEEVRRIQAFLEENAVDPSKLPGKKKSKRRVSFVEFLLPEADAVPAGFAGVALAAQASTSKWKAESCANDDDLSSSAQNECAKMAVPTKIALQTGKHKLAPIRFICPKESNGNKMEYWVYDLDTKTFVKQFFWFKNGRPARWVMGMNESLDGNFEFGKTVDVSQDVEGAAAFGAEMQATICEAGQDVRDGYIRVLQANYKKYVKNIEPASSVRDANEGNSEVDEKAL